MGRTKRQTHRQYLRASGEREREGDKNRSCNLDGHRIDSAANFKAAFSEHHHCGVVDAGACGKMQGVIRYCVAFNFCNNLMTQNLQERLGWAVWFCLRRDH